MDKGVEISKEEALKMIEAVFNKSVFPRIFGDGYLALEIGELKERKIIKSDGKVIISAFGDNRIMIAGNWTISNGKRQINSEDYVCDKNVEKIETFLGDVKIVGLEMVDKINPISFILTEGVEIFIPNPGLNPLGYFYLDSVDKNTDSLELNSDLKFIKKPRN